MNKEKAQCLLDALREQLAAELTSLPEWCGLPIHTELEAPHEATSRLVLFETGRTEKIEGNHTFEVHVTARLEAYATAEELTIKQIGEAASALEGACHALEQGKYERAPGVLIYLIRSEGGRFTPENGAWVYEVMLSCHVQF